MMQLPPRLILILIHLICTAPAPAPHEMNRSPRLDREEASPRAHPPHPGVLCANTRVLCANTYIHEEPPLLCARGAGEPQGVDVHYPLRFSWALAHTAPGPCPPHHVM